MGFRRRARELALQALYYIDIRGGDADEKIALFGKLHPPPKKSKTFFHQLLTGVIDNQKELDRIVEGYSSHWKISRMSCVDRNILRIAVFEILALGDIPVKVSINEAIDIGKKYGTEDSGAFINGILDAIHLASGQGRITFEPKTKDRVNSNDGKKNKATATETLRTALPSTASNQQDKATHRLIRLSPGLPKRMAVPPKETLKQGGEYDS